MAGADRHVCKLGTIDVLNIAQLPNRLVNHALLVVTGRRYSALALTMCDLARVILPRTSSGRSPGSTRLATVLLEVEARRLGVLLGLTRDYAT